MTAIYKTTIYVELLKEGTLCWRPVGAEYLGGDLYRILGNNPRDEVWAFSAGDVVKCKMKSFPSGGSELTAYEKINQ
jgi:hypothetical protein